MRIRFFRPSDDSETGRHLELLRRIDRFWEEVTETVAPRLRGGSTDAGALLCDAAARVGEGLVAEPLLGREGPAVVLSSRSDVEGGTLADAVVERAPELAGIAVARHRPAQPLAEVLHEVQARYRVDLSRARVRCGLGRGHLIETVVYCPEFSDGADPVALDAANLSVMGLIGERRFDDWIGAVDVAPMPRSKLLGVVGSESADRLALAELAETVDRAIAAVDEELGAAACHTYCERARWTMLELSPEAANDYAAQDDVAFAVTMLPEMTRCFLSGARFSSRRFSTVGERFAYLKLDAASLDVEARHALRLELEDALNYALVPGGLGCVVGAGLGRRYVYVMLALAELDSGVSLALKVARRSHQGDRGWLLFCDTAWAGEWVGLTDASPPPPKRDG